MEYYRSSIWIQHLVLFRHKLFSLTSGHGSPLHLLTCHLPKLLVQEEGIRVFSLGDNQLYFLILVLVSFRFFQDTISSISLVGGKLLLTHLSPMYFNMNHFPPHLTTKVFCFVFFNSKVNISLFYLCFMTLDSFSELFNIY